METAPPRFSAMSEKITRSEEEWRQALTPEQYRVLREGGTECAFTGQYWDVHGTGVFHCAGCDAPLFASDTKFNSGTGWPSFYDIIANAPVKTLADLSHGMRRVEVRCARCDSHLGHVFEDGPPPTRLRYCINSAALRFVPTQG